MIKATFTYVLVAMLCLTSSPDASDLHDLRLRFFAAARTPSQREAFHDRMEAMKASGDATLTAYLGSAKALMAEVAENPYSKWRYFNDGKSLIESAVKSDKTNPEIRYLRFMVQVNSPDFLDYKDNIPEDYEIIDAFVRSNGSSEIWARHFESFIQSKKHTIEALKTH